MKTMTPQELKVCLSGSDNVACVDVRTEAEHDLNHIPGTINIPLDQLQQHIGQLKKYDKIVVQCASGSRSAFACNVLPGLGVKDVSSLEGGIMAWEQAGLPLHKKKGFRLPLMRQVFLVAGTMNLFGLLLFVVTHNMASLLFCLLVGSGMVFSGSTGNCLMSKILIKMPWNQATKTNAEKMSESK